MDLPHVSTACQELNAGAHLSVFDRYRYSRKRVRLDLVHESNNFSRTVQGSLHIGIEEITV